MYFFITIIKFGIVVNKIILSSSYNEIMFPFNKKTYELKTLIRFEMSAVNIDELQNHL